MTRNRVEAPQEGGGGGGGGGEEEEEEEEEEGKEEMSPNDVPVEVERGGGGIAPTHSQPGTRRRWVVSTTFRRLYLRERPSTRCTRGWLGFGAGLDSTVNLDRGSIPGLPVRAGHCNDHDMLAAIRIYNCFNYKTTEQLSLCYKLGDQHIGRGAKFSLPYSAQTDSRPHIPVF